MKKTGSCLCGKCSFSFELSDMEFASCHCSICRKWSGGPSMGMHIDGAVEFDDESSVKWYHSSDWGMRGFCGECGSNLVWSMKDKSMMSPYVGSLDDTNDLKFSTELFIDEKPPYYSFSNNTRKMTGAEVFAEFAGE